MGLRIPGIYVEIQGDYTQLQADLNTARGIVNSAATGMSNALNNALSPRQAGNGINALVGHLSKLNTASKLSSDVFGMLGVDLGNLQKITGLTSAEFAQLQSRMLQTKTAQGQEKALRAVAVGAGLTRDEIRKMGEQMGVSSAAVEKIVTSIHGVEKAAAAATPPVQSLYDKMRGQSVAGSSSFVEKFAADLVAVSNRASITATTIMGLRDQLRSLSGGRTGLSEAQIDSLASRVASNATGSAQDAGLRRIAEAAKLSEREMRDLAAQLGVSKERVDALAASMYKVDAPAKQVTQTVKTMAQTINEMAASGAKGSIQSLASNLHTLSSSAGTIKAAFEGVGSEFLDVARAAGLTDREVGALQARFAKTSAAGAQERALRDIMRQCGLTEREVQRLGSRMGMTAAQIDKVTGASKKAKVEVQQTGNSMNWLGTVADTFLGVLGANTLQSFAFQMVELSRSILEVGMNLESLEMSFRAIYDDADLAAEKMAKVRVTAKELGQNFYVVAPGFRQMAAAAKETSLEGATTEKLFRGITAAATVLGMTTERTELSIKAFTDMISKGQIQMEEMKNQLGDNLPGAMQLFARAMGIGTDQLVKMAKEGQLFSDDVLPKVADELLRTYEKAAQTAALETGRAHVNRLSEEWTDLKANMYDSDSAVAGIRAITEAVDGLNAVVDGAKYINWGSFVASPSAAIVAAATSAAAKNKASTTNSMRGSVDRSNIQSVTATGVWSALDQQSMEWSIGTSNRVASAQDEAIKAIQKSREALVKYIETEKERAKATYDSAIAGARTEEERAKALKVYEDALAKIDERANKSTKNAKKGADEIKAAVASIQKDMAEMSMSEFEFDRFELDRQFEKYAEDLGAANPLLQKWLELRRQEIRLREVGHLEPYQVTELEALNRGDSFYGKAAAAERAEKMLADKNEQDLRLLTEFADKHRAIVLGETDFKLEQLDIQAEAYRRAGADEVAVAQWVAQEKLAVSREWQDGATRALQAYVDEGSNAAKSVESVMTTAFQEIEDFVVTFVETGKLEFTDLVTHINSEIARLAFRDLAGQAYSWLGSIMGGGKSSSGSSDWLGGLISTGISALGSYFGGGVNVGGAIGSSTGTGGGFNMGAGIVSGLHGGGIVGAEATFHRAVDMNLFAGAPRFHSGLMPDEFPAILRKKEGVFTEEQMKALGGGENGTNAILRELVAATRAQKPVKNVIAFDRRTLVNELSGPEGEQMSLAHIRRNASAINRILGRG